ncbi:MAG: protein translocase subunit SecF [Candidatus Zixiibacteriota bacterium]
MPIQIIGETNIDFIGKRKIALTISALLALLGVFAIVMITMGRANLGIQFTGGTMVEGYFAQAVDIGDLREALSRGGISDVEIVQITGRPQPHTFLIRCKAEEGTARKAQTVLDLIRQYFPDNAFTMDSVHEVGPAVGKTLQAQTRWAVLISLVGILLYITLRFDFRFGVGATIATFHDVLVVIGVFYLMNIEFNILLISAILTLAGYSLTDKVTVYDRIRENLKKFHRKADFVPMINRSINEVLSRTIMTGTTVLAVLIILWLVGGPVLRDFAMALILGILVGTYSSIFVASPIYVEWENRSPKRFRS